jgi:hypothetical protein
MRESLYNELRVRPTLVFGTRTGNATTTGTSVPMNFNNQNFRTALLVIMTGTMTDGSLAVTVEESPTGSGSWTAIPADRIEGGPLAAITATDDDRCYEYGVVPDMSKPFLRPSFVQTGATTGGAWAAWFLLGAPNFTPVVRP